MAWLSDTSVLFLVFPTMNFLAYQDVYVLVIMKVLCLTKYISRAVTRVTNSSTESPSPQLLAQMSSICERTTSLLAQNMLYISARVIFITLWRCTTACMLWNSLLSYLISSYQPCLSHLIKQTIYPFPSHHCLALWTIL